MRVTSEPFINQALDREIEYLLSPKRLLPIFLRVEVSESPRTPTYYSPADRNSLGKLRYVVPYLPKLGRWNHTGYGTLSTGYLYRSSDGGRRQVPTDSRLPRGPTRASSNVVELLYLALEWRVTWESCLPSSVQPDFRLGDKVARRVSNNLGCAHTR